MAAGCRMVLRRAVGRGQDLVVCYLLDYPAICGPKGHATGVCFYKTHPHPVPDQHNQASVQYRSQAPSNPCLCRQPVCTQNTLDRQSNEYGVCPTSPTTFKQLLDGGWSISSLWAPAHSGIPGNEEADALAKLGAARPKVCDHARVTKSWLQAQC